jgi:poly(3-hydroxybutyrate) depolymerase
MIYQGYQLQSDAMEPIRAFARAASAVFGKPWPIVSGTSWLRGLAASNEVMWRTRLTHSRPDYAIAAVQLGNRTIEVREEAALVEPFGTLLHFKKDIAQTQPRVLLVAPMSGHFATLLRPTVQTMLQDHDVYITDWHNARNVSLENGRFDLDDFVAFLIKSLEAIGPHAHLVAICQPSVPALAAAAIMAEDDNPARPRSLTLMAGPIDTRIAPTKVNRFAESRSIDWFEHNLIATVPPRFGGAKRRVYPGFLQLLGFMSMNMERHTKAFRDLFSHLVKGDIEKAEAIRKFYEEYFAVMDLPAEFFLQTVREVFQEHRLPRGEMTFRGRKVNAAAIRRTALLTVEGERDDICAVGQTLAAQDLCTGIRPYLKRHHVQTGVGHYGVFSGKRWTEQIYPHVREVIHFSS